MYEEVFHEYHDSAGNYHMEGTVTGHRTVYADDESCILKVQDGGDWTTLKYNNTILASEIKQYLLDRLDEWNALGDRKYEPANMWGYNFIMKCLDDLEEKMNNITL